MNQQASKADTNAQKTRGTLAVLAKQAATKKPSPVASWVELNDRINRLQQRINDTKVPKYADVPPPATTHQALQQGTLEPQASISPRSLYQLYNLLKRDTSRWRLGRIDQRLVSGTSPEYNAVGKYLAGGKLTPNDLATIRAHSAYFRPDTIQRDILEPAALRASHSTTYAMGPDGTPIPKKWGYNPRHGGFPLENYGAFPLAFTPLYRPTALPDGRITRMADDPRAMSNATMVVSRPTRNTPDGATYVNGYTGLPMSQGTAMYGNVNDLVPSMYGLNATAADDYLQYIPRVGAAFDLSQLYGRLRQGRLSSKRMLDSPGRSDVAWQTGLDTFLQGMGAAVDVPGPLARNVIKPFGKALGPVVSKARHAIGPYASRVGAGLAARTPRFLRRPLSHPLTRGIALSTGGTAAYAGVAAAKAGTSGYGLAGSSYSPTGLPNDPQRIPTVKLDPSPGAYATTKRRMDAIRGLYQYRTHPELWGRPSFGYGRRYGNPLYRVPLGFYGLRGKLNP